ncbi:MAG: PSD1 and planctomycete cytochrome C domain-containing protein [Acidobacteriota bacterium]
MIRHSPSSRRLHWTVSGRLSSSRYQLRPLWKILRRADVAAGLVALAYAPLAHSQDGTVKERAQSILQDKCVMCHGASRMSGLDLTHRLSALRGGTRGPAIKPGKAEESLLYRAAAHQGDLKMPPGSAAALPSEELEILRSWIDQGAEWPDGPATARRTEPSWWSLKKLRRPTVPDFRTGNRSSNPIDAFILAKLNEKGLKAAPLADKRTLLRRACFDLTGLPPTPEQAEWFLSDSSPEAFAKLVDELLASPRYGERWGRYWLDVVRYADSAGFEGDVYYPNAWRYRDYVIKSFNEDKPYDRFVQEQIAGDELWPDQLELPGFYDVPLEKLEHLEARIGTGMYTFGPEIQESHLDGQKLRYEWLTDAVDTTTAAFMGLSLGCARCHDHKFDPFPQKDYFRLQAIFATSRPVQIPVVTSLSATHRDEAYHWMIALDETRRAYRTLEKTVKDRVIESRKSSFPADVVRAFETAPEKRSARDIELAGPLLKEYSEIKMEEHFSEGERDLHRELSLRLVSTVLSVPEEDASHRVRFDGFFDLPMATVLGHLEPELIPPTYVLDRGDLGKNVALVGPGIPAILNDGSEPDTLLPDREGPRYRRRLALWLTQPDHPLTARVMINRIWQGHFGGGLVSTANDFGQQGSLPTHPDLLDWLACELVSNGWSVKSMHRLIMLSDAYQRASRFTDADNSRQDPENLYLWRMNRRRLEAEAVWDSIHAVAGTLNLKMGGRPVMPPLSEAEMAALRVKPWWVPPADSVESNRRGVYILSRRNFSFPMFDKFDRPDPASSCARREVTTVAPQVLWTLNNSVPHEQARHFAAELVSRRGNDPLAWIREAWRIALVRPPDPEEEEEAMALLRRLEAEAEQRHTSEPLPKGLATLKPAQGVALSQLCLTLFNLNEFILMAFLS